MANHDKSRQQSSFMPQSGAQQGGGNQGNREEQGRDQQQGLAQQQQRATSGSLVPQQGTFLGSADRNFGSPFNLMQRLTADMDRLFENFGLGMFSRGAWPLTGLRQGGFPSGATWSPHIEMFEEDGRLIVQAELPGLRKEDVQVQVEDEAVVIQGERRTESQHNQSGRYVSERSYGSFYRVIPLPDGVDSETANATFRDGMLRIEMPLSQRPRGRRLEIGDAGSNEQRSGAGARQGGAQSQQPQQPQQQQSGNTTAPQADAAGS